VNAPRKSASARPTIHDLLPKGRSRPVSPRRKLATALAALLVIGSIPPIVALTAGAGPSSYSLFSGQTGPSRASWGDSHSVEVGVQFSSSVGGTVTALNYWKAAKGTNATRSGHLWDASGRLLASVSFSNDTASGWQQASLSSPVALAPNAMYVVSYFAPWGGYVSTHNYFASSASNGPLSAPSSNNGVFCYSSAPCFPTNTYMASNYWADIVFVASDSTTSSPTVAPTTVAPTTVAPTTVAPTTVAPTTVAPTTVAPTTTTVAPTTTTTAAAPVQSAPPVSSGTQTTNCWPAPHLCGFADATNSGIQPGATLTQVPSQATSGSGWQYNNGGVTITGNVGSATSGLELADGVTAIITGSNLTVQNLKLDGAHGESTSAVTVKASTSGVTISHCDVTGAPDSSGEVSTQRGWVGIRILGGATSFSVNYCNIHGFAGSIFPDSPGGNDVFIGNYIHHVVSWDTNGTDHCNTWGDTSGPGNVPTTMLFQDNTFDNGNHYCASAAFAFYNDFGPNANLHAIVQHNLLATAAPYCINPGYGDAHAGPNVSSYLAIRGNDFSSAYNQGCGQVGPSYVWPVNSTYGPGGCPTWPTPCGGSPTNYNCANYWDAGPLAGSSADLSFYYPTTYHAPTACPNPAPW